MHCLPRSVPETRTGAVSARSSWMVDAVYKTSSSRGSASSWALTHVLLPRARGLDLVEDIMDDSVAVLFIGAFGS